MYEVIKEYAGIKVGTPVTSNNRSVIKHMIKEGYWKEKKIEPIKAKVEPTKRLKKVEPMKRKKK